MDLSSDLSMYRYKRILETRNPEIVFLVNAAGFGKISSVENQDIHDIKGMIDVNIRSLTLITKLSLPYMSKNSRIIQFASAAAFLPQPNFSVYAASKSYVLSFSRALNEELRGSGCKVTAVCPGPVSTEFFEIAESEESVPFYKRLVMSDCESVVREALVDSVVGRDISVYSLPMKTFRAFSKLPHSILLTGLRIINHQGDM